MDQAANQDIQALHERMLRKQLWVIITKRVAPVDEVKKHLKAHLEHQISLEKQGVMYSSSSLSTVRARTRARESKASRVVVSR